MISCMWIALFSWCAVVVAPASPSPPKILVTSSGTHIWVAAATQGGCRVVHHTDEMSGAFYGEVVQLPAFPIAIAAWENRMMIVMPGDAIDSTKPVYSVSTRRNPATGAFFYEPIGRLDVQPPIESQFPLRQLVVDNSGPIALLGTGTPELLIGNQSSWSSQPLPAGFPADLQLVSWPDPTDQSSWALCFAEGVELVTMVPTASSEGAASWTRTVWAGAGVGFQFALTGCARPTVMTRAGDGALALAYPGPVGLRTLNSIDPPSESWAVVGYADAFRLIWIDQAEAIHLAPLNALTGAVGTSEILVVQTASAGEWFHLPLIGVVTITMLLAGFILRPPIEPTHPMPGGWEALGLARRTGALAIDLIPGAALALAVTGAAPSELLSMPSWSADLESSLPATIMLGFTGVWSLIFEVALRATPGKFLVGGRIVRAPDGGTDMRAGAGRALVRGLLKCVVLFAPALGFLSFVHPLQQGLPETLSRTVVARRR